MKKSIVVLTLFAIAYPSATVAIDLPAFYRASFFGGNAAR